MHSRACALWLTCLTFIGLSVAQVAGAETRTFSIEAQPLDGALNAFARQANREIFFAPELTRGKQTHGVNGTYDDLTALKAILENTGLTYTITASNAILVREQSKELPTADASAGADRISMQLEEVVVTAQKRAERLQDVPVPVTALSGESLVNNNLLRIQDFYTRVPGLNFSPSGQVVQLLSIRGLTTGPGNPTVAVTVDDMPYGTATNNGGGLAIPDIDPGDLARIEVLRGPQGTLYGASSLGGLLKFVTVDPSTERMSGRVQMGLSTVENGDDNGYNLRGSVNMPLSDTFAVRASGFTRRDPGYIDNITTGRNGVNSQRVSGGRLAALWLAPNDFSLKLSALYQDTRVDGSSDINGNLGDLQQDYIRGTGDFDLTAQAYGATLSGSIGKAELTVVSGYSINEFRGTTDLGSDFDFFTAPVFGPRGNLLLDDSRAEKFSQEVRISIPVGATVDWLLGAFYTHEDTEWLETLHAVDRATGVRVDPHWGSIDFPSTYSEIAAFTDVTYQVSDRFDVQVGARQSRIRQSSRETDGGALYTGSVLFPPQSAPYVLPVERTRDNAFTYLITPRFKVSQDLMAYARFASGYRTGGTNLPPGLPHTYAPDETQNYELGLKGSFLDNQLSVDASVYYIDWKDIQLSVLDPASFQIYKLNASRARSQGVEVSMEAKPLAGLAVVAWVVWNDAELTDDFPPGVGAAQGVAGDRLPYSSRFTASLSIDRELVLTQRTTGFLGATLSYVGERPGVFRGFFQPSAQRQQYPSYAQTDVRAGVQYEDWTVNLFVNNLTDKRAPLTGGLGNFPAFAFKYIQPRTFGLSVAKAF